VPLQCLMELEQGLGLDDDGEFAKALGVDDERSQTQKKAIAHREIRRASPRAVQDEKLMFKNQGFRDDGAGATWA